MENKDLKNRIIIIKSKTDSRKQTTNALEMGFFKHFLLLTAKNFMVMQKSIAWTICELLLPVLFGFAILFFANFLPKDVLIPAVSGSDNVTLSDTCRTSRGACQYKMVYSWETSISESDIKPFVHHLFTKFEYPPMPFSSRGEMMKFLEEQESKNSKGNQAELSYGVHFTAFDGKTRELAYEMNVNGREEIMLGETWAADLPYGLSTGRTMELWTKNYVRVQHIIDSMFQQFAEPETISSPLTVNQLPVDSKIIFETMESGWLFGYTLYFIMLPTVIHTVVEISSEKESGMKDFLRVMGISTPAFYFSHIFMGWLKGFVILLFSFGYTMYKISTFDINFILILFTANLYVLATVCFAAMMSALFKSTGAALKVSIVLHIVLVFVGILDVTLPSQSKPLFAFLASLNYNAGMNFCVKAMSNYGLRNRPLSFTTFFEDVGYFFNLGPAILTIMFDIIWMLLIMFLADYVRSKTNFSICNLLCFWKRNREEEAQDSQNTTETGQSTMSTVSTGKSLLPDSQEVNGCQTPVDINVENLVKVWSTGERAVDGMNLQAHRGQVTVLLGHNGAGKSTTFNVISGTTPATSGVVNVDPSIGLCPQGNAMFNRLTVRQHLWFFHKIKGGTTSWSEEGAQLMISLDMLSQQYCPAKKLSGGQKRKLCLMIALVGNSRVVLLDEPTAGMDTGARSTVKQMLEMAKKERTILLTTHYMDEAESLGDTITIMVRGKNVAGGSPQFLKKRFGTGYMLMVVLESNEANIKEMADKVLQFTHTHIPAATLQSCNGKQMTMVLPTEEQSKFADLFTGLEGAKQTMGIESFGISLDTLEHVFLKVGELVDKDTETSSTPQIYDAVMDGRRSGCGLYASQFLSMLRKRCVYGYRNWSQWIFQIFVPVAIAFIFAGIMRMSTSVTDGRPISLESMGHMTAVVAVSGTQGEMYKRMMELLKKADNVKINEIAFDTNLTVTITNLQKLPAKMPPIALAMIFVDDEVLAFTNINAYHMVSVFQNLFANAQMHQGSISTVVRSYGTMFDKNEDATTKRKDNSLMIAGFFIFSFSFITSAFSTFIVTERVSKFAHQQFLAGLSPIIYWTAAILYDLTIYVVTVSMIVGALVLGKMDDGKIGFIILSIAALFFAIMPFVYAISFLFTSPSKANVLLIVWQMFAPLGVYLILLLAAGFAPKVFEYLQMVVDVFFPILVLCRMVENLRSIAEAERTGASSKDMALKKWNYWKRFIQLAVCAFIFTTIFVLCRLRVMRRMCGRMSRNIWGKPSEDSDVKAEQAYVQQNTGKFVLEVNALSKTYGRICALSDLTFGVKAKECFGLLGTNGAGKTTTFGILTGEQFASSGEATIDGRSVQSNTVRLGYCPQFDAMLPDLTGRECLEIFASLIGYANPSGKAQMILKAVLMEEHADKRYKNLSGGQKRKISVGVALLAQTTLTILDEPTAGIDPKARREIWSFLSTVREHDNSALLLTSHSMDECEAICTKIAILVQGQMVAVGTSQHLKSKYSNNYLLTLILGDPQKEGELKQRGDYARKEVQTQFPGAVERTDFTNDRILKFMIPKKPDDKWSALWQKAKQVSETSACKDYSITQSTLTETFLELQRETTNAVRQYA